MALRQTCAKHMVVITCFLYRSVSPVFDLLVIGDHGSEHGKKLMCIKDTDSPCMKAAIVTVHVCGAELG